MRSLKDHVVELLLKKWPPCLKEQLWHDDKHFYHLDKTDNSNKIPAPFVFLSTPLEWNLTSYGSFKAVINSLDVSKYNVDFC
jgi:hypothetical protein